MVFDDFQCGEAFKETGPAFIDGFGSHNGDGACGGGGGQGGGEGDAVIAAAVDCARCDLPRGDGEAVVRCLCIYTQCAEHGGCGGDAVAFFGAQAADAGEGGAGFCGEDGEGHEEVGCVGEVHGLVGFYFFYVLLDLVIALDAVGRQVCKAYFAAHGIGDDGVGGVAVVAFNIRGDVLDVALMDGVDAVFFFDVHSRLFHDAGGHADVGGGGGILGGDGSGAALGEARQEGAGDELAGGFCRDLCVCKCKAAFCLDRPGAFDFHAVFFQEANAFVHGAGAELFPGGEDDVICQGRRQDQGDAHGGGTFVYVDANGSGVFFREGGDFYVVCFVFFCDIYFSAERFDEVERGANVV